MTIKLLFDKQGPFNNQTFISLAGSFDKSGFFKLLYWLIIRLFSTQPDLSVFLLYRRPLQSVLCDTADTAPEITKDG